MENEIWKALPEINDLIEVSSLGRVRAKKGIFMRDKNNHKRCIKPKIYKPRIVTGGYVGYKILSKDYLAHRLVCLAFIPNPDNLPCVNHINGIKTDNRVDNLEWITYFENQVHAASINLRKPFKLMVDDVVQIKKRLLSGEKPRQIAQDYNCSHATIYDIKKGKNWNHVTL